MRIAIVGTRGIPARYGGYETFAEEIAIRMARAGHEVTVYGRHRYYPERSRQEDHAGVHCVYLGGGAHPQLETALNALLSVWHLFRHRTAEAVVVCNNTNGYLLPVLRLLGKRFLINVDGLEWQRGKWGFWSRNLHRLAEKITVFWGRRHLVADSLAIAAYYQKTYRETCHFISYGAPLLKPEPDDADRLQALGLRPGHFFLQITRFVPENNVDLILRAFARVGGDTRLVLVGGDPYGSAYNERIHELANHDERVLLTGPQYDAATLRALMTGCGAYVHGNEVGGTNPALLQAMGAGALVLALDTVFNREVLRRSGFFFPKDEDALTDLMTHTLALGEGDKDDLRQRAREVVGRHYQWDAVARAYLEVLLGQA